MSDSSVSAIRLPSVSRGTRRGGFSRRTLLRLFERLRVGSLVIHEGDETLRFGTQRAGEPDAIVNVHDPAAYHRVLTGGTLGSGEAFMQGLWSSPDLVSVIRLFSANMSVMQNMNAAGSGLRRVALKLAHYFNRNSLEGSRRNISAHYDLGNDFFALFLDPTMMYSSAVFPSAESTLEEASEYKLDLLCRDLDLQPQDHLLEIGTGWGGMAIHAARHYGCRVTTTTISREQFEYASARVAEEGLQDRITVLCEDYRDLEGRYDKLVSVEMIEAVGHQWYSTYFNRCSELLRPGGRMAIQAITMADQRYEQARDAVDFIKRYVFPGGCLPSIEVMAQHVRRDTDMQITGLRDITEDYADTLACWRERFEASLPQVREMGFDETFERLWEFYLCYCEGGFRERIIGTVQMTLSKPLRGG